MVRFARCATSSSRRSTCSHRREATPPRGRPCHRRRVPGAEASTTHQQSLPPARSKSHHPRSRGARTGHAVREPAPDSEVRRAHEAGRTVQVPQGTCRSQVSSALFPRAPVTANLAPKVPRVLSKNWNEAVTLLCVRRSSTFRQGEHDSRSGRYRWAPAWARAAIGIPDLDDCALCGSARHIRERRAIAMPAH